MSTRLVRVAGAVSVALSAAGVAHGVLIPFSGPGGLAGEAEFTLVNATTLQVRLRNTSTGVPVGFEGADQLLTSVSWDFGAPGNNPGEPTITGGTVVIGPSGATVNFSLGALAAGADVSGEWGFGNGGTTSLHPNFISSNTAGATPFGGVNRDGPAVLDGPQGGLVASPLPISLGGQGGIQDEIVATLTLSSPLADLSFLERSDAVTFEFGSDRHFITNPTPGAGSAVLCGLGLGMLRRRRR